MEIKLANHNNSEEITHFFGKYLDSTNDAITSREFFCPFGLKAAIKRKQVMVCIFHNQIIGAIRFYPRKTDNIVSVYQFAIATNHRGKKLFQQMLIMTGYKMFEVLCPLKSEFNNYYKKTKWILKKQNTKHNYWILTS